MTRVLVTGASGFLGGHLAEMLAESGVAVRGLVRDPTRASFLEHTDVELVTGDIMDPETLGPALDGIDTVFHVAAVLGPAHLPDRVYREINVDGTRNLIEACRKSGGIQRFVFVSSVGVLGPLPAKGIACEGTPPQPQDIYEITKLEAEELVLKAAADGFPTVVGRPGWVYGPRDTRTLKLIRMIARRRFMLIGKARNKQHPIWVKDVVTGLIRCAVTAGVEGRVYHLAGPEVVRVEELCTKIAEATGVSLLGFQPPLWMIQIPALIIEKIYSIWGGDPPVDHRKADFFVINRAYSIKRAKAELNWVPGMKLRNGLEETVQWYRENGML